MKSFQIFGKFSDFLKVFRFFESFCDLRLDTWDTDYISDNWEQQYEQLHCDLWIQSDGESIHNSCDVFEGAGCYNVTSKWQLSPTIPVNSNSSQLFSLIIWNDPFLLFLWRLWTDRRESEDSARIHKQNGFEEQKHHWALFRAETQSGNGRNFSKLYFSKVHFSKVYFPNCIS